MSISGGCVRPRGWGGPLVYGTRDAGSHIEILFRHPKYGEKVSKVSREQFSLIVEGSWRLSIHVGRLGKRSEPLLRVNVWSGERRDTLAGMLYPCPPGFVRDHINGDTLDDRPENIRLLTIAENATNNWKRRAGGEIEEGGPTKVVSFRVPLDGYDELKERLSELGKEKYGVYRAIKTAIL